MSRWTAFLDSLATRGGNIFVLLMICLFLSGLVYHVLHHNEVNTSTAAVIMTTFSAFTGSLMNALQGGGSKQRNGDANGNGKPPEVKP